MKTRIIFLATLLCIAITLKADKYDKIQVLKEEKQALKIKMHHKRVEIIKKDQSLQDLQKKIIALHKELAIRIDNNEEMRELISKLREIETQIKLVEGGDKE